MNQPTEQSNRWILRAAKLTIFLLLAYGLWATLATTLVGLGKNPPHVEPLWLVVSGCLYLLGELPAAIFWHRVMRCAHQQVPLGKTLYAFYVSQAGQYAPGKALVIVLRAAILRGPGIETTVVAASVFVATLTTMAVGAVVAAAVLLHYYWWPDADHPRNLLFFTIAVAIAVATGLPTVPAILKRMVHILGIGKINPTAADKLGGVPMRVFIVGWLALAVGWVVQGLSLWAVLYSLGSAAGPLVELPLHTATVSLAVVAGFVSLIPGGFLGRELAHIKLLTPFYGEPTATVSAVILRLVWLVSEVAVSVILYACGRRARGPVSGSLIGFGGGHTRHSQGRGSLCAARRGLSASASGVHVAGCRDPDPNHPERPAGAFAEG